MTRPRQDTGETLVEVLLTVVIVGLTFTALISSLGMAGNAGNSQRQSVQADVVMRNYAEAAKAAVQTCVVGGTYTVAAAVPLPADPTLPVLTASLTVAGSPGVAGVAIPCPPLATTQVLTLQVRRPDGTRLTMDIRVRTP